MASEQTIAEDDHLKDEEITDTEKVSPQINRKGTSLFNKERRIGGAKDVILKITEDFDQPLDDFAEYMT